MCDLFFVLKKENIMAESKNCCNHIFISYCQADKEIVNKISNKLEKFNYKIYINRGNNSVSTAVVDNDIQKRMNNSHLIICFMSQKYFKTKNYKEFIFARNQNKIILPIILDDYFKVEDNRANNLLISLSQMNTFYAYKSPNTFITWSSTHFEKLKTVIYKLISEVCVSND